MIRNVSSLERSGGLFAASGSYGGAALGAAVVGALRSKVTAEAVGPAGVGVLTQLNLAAVLAGALCSAGLGNVGVKVLSEARARGDHDQERRLLSLVMLLPLGLALLLLGVVMPLRDALAGVLLADPSLGDELIISLCSVPLNMVIVSFGLILQARGQLTRLAALNFVGAVLATAAAVTLVLLLGFRGAVLAIVATSLAPVALVALCDLQAFLGLSMRCWPSRRYRTALTGLAVATLAVSVLTYVGEASSRAVAIRMLGPEALGYYQPAILLNTQVFLPLISGVTVFLLPVLTTYFTMDDLERVRLELAKALRLVMLVMVPLCLLLVAVRKVFLFAVFSSEFQAAAPLLAVQIPGQALLAASYVVGAALIPAGRMAHWAALAVLVLVVQTGSTLVLLPHMGYLALPTAFVVTWAINLSVTVVVVRRLHLEPSSGSALLVSGLALIVAGTAAAALIGPLGDALAAAGAASWLWVATTAAERKRLWRRIARLLRRDGG